VKTLVGKKFRALYIGLLLLSGLIILVSHFGEVEHFVQLLRQLEPAWLIVALLLQATTYFCVASVWFLALRAVDVHQSLLSLMPLAVAKLFSDQAMPSGGMSGTAFFIAALNRRGIANHLCMATLLLSLVSFYGAYMGAALLTVFLLAFYHALYIWVILVVIIFSLVAVGMPSGILCLRSLGQKTLPPLLLHIPGLKELMQSIANAPRELLHNRALIITTTLLHSAVFFLDIATLWIMLHVLGLQISYLAVFPSFILASMVATIGPIPLGLGTFEATCVSMLRIMGVPIEAALTATLLLRGFTLWLPMLPGMLLARRALR